MKLDINWAVNTAIITLNDGQEIELSYNEFKELRNLLNEDLNNDR